jgi:hypothetical protein
MGPRLRGDDRVRLDLCSPPTPVILKAPAPPASRRTHPLRRLPTVLIALAALALTACHPQSADAPPAAPPLAAENPALTAASAAAHQAAARFAVLARDASRSGIAPRAADPAVGPLVDSVFDTTSVPTAPVPMSQFPAIDDWLSSVATVGRTYVLAGTGAARDDDPSGPVVAAQVDKNFAAYAPELGRYLDAQNALMALEASSLQRQLAADPAWAHDQGHAKGLAILRSTITRGVGPMLALLAQPGPTDDWRRARMPYLLALATQVAKLGDPADLAALRTQAQTTYNATDDETLKADLQYMASVLGG